MGRLEGKVALVTGAGRGQGRSHCATLAREGAEIVAVDLLADIDTVPYSLATRGDLDETASLVAGTGRQALTIEADVRSGEQMDAAVEQAVERFGRVDILCANAGIWSRGSLHELTDEAWKDMLDVNLTGVWHATKAVVPGMVAQQSGAVVMTSSLAGLEGEPGYAHYVAAKHGVIGLMRAAAIEYARENIRVNAVCPGFIDTPMGHYPGAYEFSTGRKGATREDQARAAHHWAALAKRGPLTPESVSDAVLWLASDESRDVTGVALPVDGGHMVLPGFNTDPVFS